MGFVVRVTLALALATWVTCATAIVRGQEYTRLFVFGDSLSDVGNVYAATEGAIPPSPPYYAGRFTNGPVWVEQLASELELNPLTPSLSGGSNFAFGGAQTGFGTSTIADGVPNVGVQIEMFSSTGTALTANDLVVLWAGHNDLSGGIPATVIADNISQHITALHGLGAQRFLVGNLVTFSDVNGRLSQVLEERSATLGLSIALFDFNALMTEVFANPAPYGITNLLEPACVDCADGTTGSIVVADPATHLLWDEIHPTAGMHRMMGVRAYESLVAVPEPQTCGPLLLMILVVLNHRGNSVVRLRRSVATSG